ncbi:DKNYY domain-containing protein [Pseudorhodoferax sp.]|uniref:DKNYY domain-containing protein n=1 Tax=Pseudorhodoferax sp. TaxID=1993553 RepID=UPI0039E4BB22
MADPVCYLPSRLQIHRTMEIRKFWLVSEDGDNFRLMGSHRTDLVVWQRQQLNRYAADRTAVYLNDEKLPEADPQTFEVLFPYGSDTEWQDFYFARDRHNTYIDTYLVPDIDLGKIAWLPLRCIEGSISCRDSADHVARIGIVGRDIVFLRDGNRPTVFRNQAKPDLLCFRFSYTSYCRIDGKLYAIQPAFEAEARLIVQDPALQRDFDARLAAGKP